MRRLIVAAFSTALLATPAAADSPRGASALAVNLDQGTRISLSRPARDIVVANPTVADVTLLDARNIVVLGKAVGATSLLVVDAAGRTVIDRQVIVSAPEEGRMSLYRGPLAIQDFACAPRCAQVGRTETPAAAAPGASPGAP